MFLFLILKMNVSSESFALLVANQSIIIPMRAPLMWDLNAIFTTKKKTPRLKGEMKYNRPKETTF